MRSGHVASNRATASTPIALPPRSTAGAAAAMWFSESLADQIGRLTTAGVITDCPVPVGSKPDGITTGPDGTLWIAMADSDMVGRMTTDGTLTEWPIPTPDSHPEDIVTGPDGNLCMTEYVGNK